MAYGSSRLRAFYGAGDYSTGLALMQARGYVGGRYGQAGGFFSSLGKMAGKVLSPVSKVLSNPLVGGALSLIPGGGLLGKAAQIGAKVLSSPIVKTGAKLAGAAAVGAATSSLVTRALAPSTPTVAFASMAPARGGARHNSGVRSQYKYPRKRKRRRSRGRSSRRTSSRRRFRLSYERGDWGDDGGRDKRGHYLNARGGHRHLRRRRRARGGRRVSFVTKDGRRVSFTPRGDALEAAA